MNTGGDEAEFMNNLFRGVKHKLNDDMQVVVGCAELAEELGRNGGDAREHVRSIALAASKAIERIEQLAALNAVGQASFAPVDLNALLCANIKILQAGLPPIVTLKLELEPLSTPVKADPVQLGLSLSHVVRSAAVNMPYGGEIIVSTLDGHRRSRDNSSRVIAQVLAIKAISTVNTSADIGSGDLFQHPLATVVANDDFESALKVCGALVERAAECDVCVSHTSICTKFTTRFTTEN